MQTKQNKKHFTKLKRGVLVGGILTLAVALIFGAAISSSTKNIPNTNLEMQKEETKNYEEEIKPTNSKATEFALPLLDFEVYKDYSSTALKYNATLKQWEAHKAVDLKTNEGSEIRASLDGKVVAVENDYLKGNLVKIAHDGGFETVYASLSNDVLVSVGDDVKQGDVIGFVSATAKNEMADGAHLHFEILKDSVSVDPNLYLTFEDK